jgi:hypothetical protein
MAASFRTRDTTATGNPSYVTRASSQVELGKTPVKEGEDRITSGTVMDEATTEEQLEQTSTLEPEGAEAFPSARAEPEDLATQELEQVADELERAAQVREMAEAQPVKAEDAEADEDDVADSAIARTNVEVIPSKKGRGRRVLTILAAVLGAALLLFVAGVAYATYDYKNDNDGKILPGATVAGVDVGGMSEKQALRAVKRAVAPRLESTIAVGFGDREWEVTPKELKARSNAKSAVQAAVDASEAASWTDLAQMRFLDGELDLEEDVSINYSRKGAKGFIAGLEDEVNAEPRDASIDYSSGWVEITKEREGHELIVGKSTKGLMASMKDGDSRADLEVNSTKPEVTAASFDQVLLVRQGDFRVYLYEDGKITHDWPIAVGTSEYPTPTGVFSVELKRYMPTWINPAPDGWGADMPAMIPPGPSNPLGLRAINWTAAGIRFHGTSATHSIGTAASHGCVRMYNEDVIELYDLIDEGAPIVSTWG